METGAQKSTVHQCSFSMDVAIIADHSLDAENMTKLVIHTDNAPKSLAGYSQGIKSNGFVFVSGQGPFDARTGDVVGTTIQEQTAQCLRNVEAILHAAGSSLDKAVQ